MAYSADLGNPRAFIIDSFGSIKKVIPQEAFDLTDDAFQMIANILMTEF